MNQNFPAKVLNSFCLVIKETSGLVLSWWRIIPIFCWLTLERCFQLVQPGAVLVGIKSFSFPEGTHYRGLSFNPTTYTTSPALDEDRLLGWLMGGSFHLSQDLFHSTLLYSIHFHHPSQFVLKVNNFVMFKYRESHAEIRSRRFFFLHLTYVEPKHQSG